MFEIQLDDTARHPAARGGEASFAGARRATSTALIFKLSG
jgi:hypothetical protein